jgi:hypothetical protein
MPDITLDDVKTAVSQADQRRANRNDGGFAVHLSVGDVNVIYGTQPQGNRTLVNYGLPYMYTLPRANIAALQAWWEARHPNTGTLLAPQLSDGVWKINLQWVSTNDNVFNMHVGVPAQ